MDRLCHALFQRHLAETNTPTGQKNFDILLAAQALERIGDHAKNLAEELSRFGRRPLAAAQCQKALDRVSGIALGCKRFCRLPL